MDTGERFAPDVAEFYCGDGTVLIVEGAAGSITIRCEGEMRILIGSGDDYEVVRTNGGLRDIGVNNDYDLAGLLRREDVEVANNPWFAAYDRDGEELFIEHSLQAAAATAARMVA